jgi:hypothetical protein
MEKNEAPPILINNGEEGAPTLKSKKKKRKFNWGKFMDFDWKQPREKIRFGITYLLTGLGFILASDILQLIKMNTTAGFMVAIGIILLVMAVAVPIIVILSEID